MDQIENPFSKVIKFPNKLNNCQIKMNLNTIWIYGDKNMISFEINFINDPQFKTKKLDFDLNFAISQNYISYCTLGNLNFNYLENNKLKIFIMPKIYFFDERATSSLDIDNTYFNIYIQ